VALGFSSCQRALEDPPRGVSKSALRADRALVALGISPPSGGESGTHSPRPPEKRPRSGPLDLDPGAANSSASARWSRCSSSSSTSRMSSSPSSTRALDGSHRISEYAGAIDSTGRVGGSSNESDRLRRCAASGATSRGWGARFGITALSANPAPAARSGETAEIFRESTRAPPLTRIPHGPLTWGQSCSRP
jgi:hypothetical protein